MRELVIVIADLYLEPELAGRTGRPAGVELLSCAGPSVAAGAGAMPGIERLARFADRSSLTEGWRAWVARWAGLARYAREAPASIASVPLAEAVAGRAVWLATPLHLITGLSSLHVDRRGLLRLPKTETEELAASFRETFRGSGFDLHPLESGELLLSAPEAPTPSSSPEPARMPLTSVAEALAGGERAPALRRLSAEIEMWLHGHALNARREERGAPVVGTLWLWGGGPATLAPAAASHELAGVAFGSDSYVQGLWCLAGGETRPMPVDWSALIGEPRAQRALGIVRIAELLQTEACWHLADAVAEIDRRLISPALEALERGELERLVLVANDRCLTLRAVNRWRLWRRKRPALAGLA